MNWNARTNIKRAAVAFVIGLTAFFFLFREPTEQLTIELLASARQRWRLAKIVHSADVAADRDADPIAPGLEAIAVDYSLRFPEDLENLPQQFDV